MVSFEALTDALRHSSTIERAIGKAIAEKDSGRIFHFNEIREHFLSWEIHPKRQVQMMMKELSNVLGNPKKTLHLVNLILMLFNHCDHGFSGALVAPESIQELLANYVLCRSRSNAAKKLAWLIKFVISSSENSSIVPISNDEVNMMANDVFHRDSWVPEMTVDDYCELEDMIVKKDADRVAISEVMKSIDKSDDTKVVAKYRSDVKGLECRLMQDDRFLRAIRNSFSVSEWPETRITGMLKEVSDALFAIDSLLAALRNTSDLEVPSVAWPYGGSSSFNGAASLDSNCGYSSEFRLYEAKKKEVVDKYAGACDIDAIVSVINTTDDVEVLRQQYAAAKDLQLRLTNDANDLKDFQRQHLPTLSLGEPLEHFQLQINTTVKEIESLLKTFEESSQQREPPSPPLRFSARHQPSEPTYSECNLSECKINKEPIDMATYRCPICQRIFHSQSSLNSHMKLAH
ncbi:hypothetical protein TcWFU_010262 [Taenia crassiceps]|uniref:C2H2-type domain-containing protein n=1 Tax=Taenia crassiceps TaxID=6207 RepID=A0ABR4QAA7_9CEST